MGAGRSYQLARILGIRVRVSVSWFVLLFFGIYVLSRYFHDILGGSQTTAYLVAVGSAFSFAASIVLHELGHALAARREGIETESIDLWLLGGLARTRGEATSPGAELRIAAAGPAVTLVLVALGIGIGTAISDGQRFLDVAIGRRGFQASPTLVLLSWLTTLNATVLVFNLLPAFPLDGGRIARAVVWWRTGDRNRATRTTGRVGQGFAILLGLYGVAVLTSGSSSGLWFMLLAFFMYQSAGAAVLQSAFSQQIADITVADIMDREPVAIPGELGLLAVNDEFFLRYRWPWFAVVDAGGHFLGVVHRDRVEAEIAAGRPALSAADVLDASDERVRIGENTPLETLLRSNGLGPLGAVLAVDREGVLRGVVTLAHVQRALRPAAGS